MRDKQCGVLDDAFEVAIHDLTLFPAAVIASGLTSISSVKLSVPAPSTEEVAAWTVGSSNLLANAHHKLLKRTSPRISATPLQMQRRHSCREMLCLTHCAAGHLTFMRKSPLPSKAEHDEFSSLVRKADKVRMAFCTQNWTR